MIRHPVHPMLVHLPIACWLLAPACDVAGMVRGGDFFWQAAALLSGAGVAFGALAGMAGAMELERLKGRKDLQRIATIHASLMGSAWIIALVGLIGRVDESFSARLPGPVWVVVVDFLIAAALIGGAFFGGELVYRHGVGVSKDTKA